MRCRLDASGVAPPRLDLIATAAEALLGPDAPAILGVDMPMGLPDLAEPGGRACEREARARLGPRRASVFSAPCRAALACGDYLSALAANRSGGGPGLSKQAFNLSPKLREVDALARGPHGARLREVHPELAFALMAGVPMAWPKRRAEGRAERLAALEQTGFPRALLEPHPFRRVDAAPDDVLDACAVAWSAARILRGQALRLPQRPSRDAFGLEMAIWA